jgi:hypothetical protein
MASYKSIVINHNLSDKSPRELGKKLRELIKSEFYKKVKPDEIISVAEKTKSYPHRLKPKLEPELYEKFVQWKNSVSELEKIPVKYAMAALLELYIKQIENEEQKEFVEKWTVKVPEPARKVSDEVNDEVTYERGPTESDLAEIDKQHSKKINQYIENRLNSIVMQLEELVHKYYSLQTEIQDLRREISKIKSDYEMFKNDVQRILLCID